VSVLAIRGLKAGYGEIEVLHGIDLAVDKGEIVTLIGANGAGKTTLLKTISGLIRPAGGAIDFEGRSIVRLPAHRIVGLGISQAPEGRAILKRMSVYENLLMGAYSRSDKDIRPDADAVMQRFPVLAERRTQTAGLLSGGEQQMLAIGRALMARPRLMLLDEPSLGLAPMIVTEIFRILMDLRSEGRTIFLVEQNARRALQVADRAYVMERGSITMSGTGAELLDNPAVREMYLGRQTSNEKGVASGKQHATGE
jgi:branched-chain amino acid transport system ATP-binding protein